MKILNAVRWASLGVCLGALAAGAEGREPTKQELLDALERMNQRVEQVEERLDASERDLTAAQDELVASEARVDRQATRLEKFETDRESSSGLSSFYEQVQVSGWLAGSYFWNFNDPGVDTIGEQSQIGTNSGFNGLLYPFHPDHNTFSVDQLWFEIEKPVSEESRAGFRADLLWGKTAGTGLGGGFNRSCGFVGIGEDCVGDSASDFELFQAYVQYLTPWGQTVKAGKFGTIIGYEVTPTIYNFHITRANLFNILQPFNQYGVLVEGEIEGFLYAAGVVSSVSAADPDTNNDKSFMGRLGYAGESWSVIANVLYGSEGQLGSTGTSAGSNGGKLGIFNVIADWNPNEKFSAWVDFVYSWNENSVITSGTGAPDAWGVTVAGRYGITERLGFALRAEYLEDSNNFVGAVNNFGTLSDMDDVPVDIALWGLTGTVDYELAENLVTKFELRWDHMDHSFGSTNEFVNSRQGVVPGEGNGFTNSNQVVAGVEVVYKF